MSNTYDEGFHDGRRVAMLADQIRCEEYIKNFMSDSLHVFLVDEGDVSKVPTGKFANDLSKAIINSFVKAGKL